MAFFMKEFEKFKIPLEAIKTATENFDERRVIGKGGFGKVYKGKLSHSNRSENMFAIKRLDPKYGQGDTEFYKEIRTLCCYKHENLISLLGFCKEEDETILVYEYASRGSLDRILSDVTLMWTQRIKICLDAAKGLSFLHDPNNTEQRVLHCDLKSANILLDNNMTAKVSDFGLSKMGPAKQQYSQLITNPVGTRGYCDPLYMTTYCLTKESDVYSFGVVLFEVLCGRLCAEYSNGQFEVYVPFWKQIFRQKKLEEIIFQDLFPQMDPNSLEIFVNIAYQCLHESREERPAMSHVVECLKLSLDFQEAHGHYKELVERKVLLPKGVLLDGDKTRLSITQKEQRVERIYIEFCLDLLADKSSRLKQVSDDIVNSRFPKGRYYEYCSKFQALVRGQYLTPKISYTLNLVFRFLKQSQVNDPHFFSPLRYNIINWEDETKVFVIYPTDMREDGWFIVPLYHFTSQHTTAYLQFDFDFHETFLLLAGFEFQPYEKKVELPVFEEYQHIVEDASQSLFYTSLQELKHILRIGIHLKDYKTWFSINKKGEHCHMISMKDCLIPNQDFISAQYNHTSRFPAGFYQPNNNKRFKTHVKTQLLSPSITYTVNLVFKGSHGRYGYVGLKYKLSGERTTSTVYLGNKREQSYMYMAELYQFTSDGTSVDLEIDFDNHGTTIEGVEGILFQPLLEIVEDQVSKDDKVENIQTISDSESDTFWEQNFPDEYEEVLNLSKESLMWKTKKELYSILRRGFLINSDQEWFTVDKHGRICLILSARTTWVIDDKDSACKYTHETRFGEALVITAGYKFKMNVNCEVSPDTTYAAYLVYKLPKDQLKFAAPLYVWENHDTFDPESHIYLVSPPHTPLIRPNFDENTYNPLNRYKGNGIPQQRTDGWMEVKVWQFQTTTETVSMRFFFEHSDRKNLKELMVEGIELRPI